MYKLIIGNVRIAIHDDAIPREKAIAAAQEAVQKAGRAGKHLSQIDIFQSDEGISVKTIEKAGARASRKTLKQSMYDSILAAAKENLASSAAGPDSWTDDDSGQQWHGSEVEAARSQILTELSAWLKQS
ncbi:hypothetical protein AXX12_04645 [Anaerosporomusa subterranea]|jgi:hypothetical protein|uniref:Uncharacterized protein n=1 Tax=Anaerosporomusa subterranea TaxID=1794912 RepID=A0A154BV95_ANASB|nr:hypothetical protein [Anaerosporomusa subterranea]KYZ77408.1 hypothetical protein AXX12_04645 [Anaerosporomusa subterranea]MDF2501006.1 hypothetical protein [Anaerosporomusa subterranea]